MRVLVLGVLLLAGVAAVAAHGALEPVQAPAAAAPSLPEFLTPQDVHVVVSAVAESRSQGTTLAGVENRFARSHSRVMERLGNVLRRVAKQVENKEDSLVELEGIVKPIVDNTGSLAGAPKVNTTRFSVKPRIDPTLVHDAPLAKPAALVELEGIVKPIVDGTGSLAQGAPKVNTTRFSVKPRIDPTLVHDAPLAKPAALVEVSSDDDCPTCRLHTIRQSLPIVESPVASALDLPLFEEQHRRIDYLIKGKKLSVTQEHLDSARSTIIEATERHSDFADFTDKHHNQPLLPKD